jgi:hypothetical protein
MLAQAGHLLAETTGLVLTDVPELISLAASLALLA